MPLEARNHRSPGHDEESTPLLNNRTRSSTSRHSQAKFVEFDGEDDPENPLNWTIRKKVITTVLFALTTLGCTFTSSVFSSAHESVAHQFGITPFVASLGTSLYVLAYAFGPLVFAPASEFLGRKAPLLTGYGLFALSQIIVATAQHPAAIFVGRALGGYFSSAPLGIMSGAMADIWPVETRGAAIAIFAATNFIGPGAALPVGSLIVSKYDWHMIEWLVFAYAASMTIIDWLFLPETMADVILKRKAQKLRKQPGTDQTQIAKIEEKEFTVGYVTRTYLSRPSVMLATDPIIQCFSFFSAFTFGILYLSFVAFPLDFKQERGWSQLQASLPNIAIIIGVLIGLIIALLWQPRYNKAVRENDGKPVPEMRLPLLVTGAALFPIGLLTFAMAAPESVPWQVTVLGIVLVGASIYLVFYPSLSYLVDTFQSMTASAVAANTVIRSTFGAALPLIGQKLFAAVGIKTGMLILAGVALILLPLALLFLRYGERIRHKSKFAPTNDKSHDDQDDDNDDD
ncbi:hypothetical protein PYCC9005_004103 [Savitreella phatthalungensis]